MTESDRDKYCPACEARRRWYHEVCPECSGPLEASDDGEDGLLTEAVLVTEDVGRVPLARMALDEAGIDYSVRAGPMSVAVFVSAASAEDARALLADLETADVAPALPLEATGEWQEDLPPVELFDGTTDQTLGHVTEDLLEWLLTQLDPDRTGAREVVISQRVLDDLAGAGGDADLVDILRDGLGSRREMRLRWSLR
jgi:hypothetical protein